MSFNERHKKSWPEELSFFLDSNEDCIFNNLENTVKKKPKSDAIIFYDNKISYGELFNQVRKVSGFLQKIPKISKGDRIAIIMQNCPQFIISYYAILGINCVVVPINPMLQIEEISFILDDSNIKAIFVSTEIIDRVNIALKNINFNSVSIIYVNYFDYLNKKFNVKLPDEFTKIIHNTKNTNGISWNNVLKSNKSYLSKFHDPDAICVIPYTSGSTGIPKGCKHSNRTVNTVINSYSKWLPLPSNSRILSTLPLFHVTGMQNSMNVPIFNGDTIVLMSRWNVETALYFIKKYRIKSWRSITTAIIDLITYFDPNKHDVSSLNSIGGGGASMPKNTAKRLKNITSLDYVEAYGLTETMAPTHINPPFKTKLGSIGIPLFNVDARIIDVHKKNELGIEEVGELVLCSPQLFLGYWNRPHSDNDFVKLDDKLFFKTGDLAYFDLDGYFFIVDRIKRMINYSGFKIWPAEIEKIIHNYEGIKEVCIIGIPDVRTVQKVKAIIVPEKSYTKSHFLGLKKWCQNHMARYKIPKIIELRKELPKNKMGKILWRNLQ